MEKPRQISKSKTKHKIKNILEWEDLCDDDSYDENEQFNEPENDHQLTIEEKKYEEIAPILTEVSTNNTNIKKQVFNNQPKEEMIAKINEYDKSKIIINLFNIDIKATAEDITNYYQNIQITGIHSNQNKTGNYDVEFNSKEEVLKFIEKGTGKINKRSFFMRLSYKNEKPPIYNPEPKKNNKNLSKSNQNFSKMHEYEREYYSNNRYADAEFDQNVEGLKRTTSTRVFESNHKQKYNSDRKFKPKLKKNLSGQRYHSKIEYIKKKDEETHIQDFAKVNLISQIDETIEDFHTPENKNLNVNVSSSEDDEFHSFQNSSFEKEKSPKSPQSHNINTKNCNDKIENINQNKIENANILEKDEEKNFVLAFVLQTEEDPANSKNTISSPNLQNQVISNGKIAPNLQNDIIENEKPKKKKNKKKVGKKEILNPQQRVSSNNIFDVFS